MNKFKSKSQPINAFKCISIVLIFILVCLASDAIFWYNHSLTIYLQLVYQPSPTDCKLKSGKYLNCLTWKGQCTMRKQECVIPLQQSDCLYALFEIEEKGSNKNQKQINQYCSNLDKARALSLQKQILYPLSVINMILSLILFLMFKRQLIAFYQWVDKLDFNKPASKQPQSKKDNLDKLS